jgi:prepilin-type N-terminal cleavage/methylation domain-containing protein
MHWTQNVVARTHRADDGMSLIELLIVILILGILSAIVILGVGAFQNDGESEACNVTVREVEAANAAYYAKNQVWAPNVATLVVATNYLKTAPRASWGIAVSGRTHRHGLLPLAARL